MNLLKKSFLFIADEIFHIKRFISSIVNSTKLRKREFLKEKKYIQDFKFLMDTVEDCICVSPDASMELERRQKHDADYLFFELLSKVTVQGRDALTEAEVKFLEEYKNTNDKNFIS